MKTESVFKLVPGITCHALDVDGIYTKHFVEYLYGRNVQDMGSEYDPLG
ncbi:hypothetical protein J6A31_05235 [bacterium]|nr:hypothetical protein [bacterium]